MSSKSQLDSVGWEILAQYIDYVRGFWDGRHVKIILLWFVDDLDFE